MQLSDVPPTSGYSDAIFMNNIPPILRCIVCRFIVRDAFIACPDGHLCCGCCLPKLRECPVCSKHCFAAPPPCKAARAWFSTVQVRCPSTIILHPNEQHTQDVCAWTGLLSQLDVHWAKCDFAPISCPRCSTIVTRARSTDHICSPSAMASCRYCSTVMARDVLQTHEHRCQRRPIRCPRCCGAIFPQGEIETHGKTCMLIPVACPVSGCANHFQRHEMAEHMFGKMMKPMPERIEDVTMAFMSLRDLVVDLLLKRAAEPRVARLLEGLHVKSREG